MKVLAVTIENYGAFYGTHQFRYAGRGLAMVLGENLDEPRMNSNGAAKSTLFECLDWCWYGKVPKEDHADSIINDEARTCYVSTYLEDDDGTPAVIKRSRPNALQFWMGSKELTCLDTKETQRLVDDFLGMDRDVFKATVFFGQNDLFHFADVGDAKRVEILTKIIPELAAVDEYLERAKARQQRETAALEQARRALDQTVGALKALEGINYAAQQEQWEETRRKDQATVEARSQELTKYIMEHQSQIEHLPTLTAQRDQLSTALPQPIPGDALQKAEQQVQQSNHAAVCTGMEAQRLQKALDKIHQTREGVCFECGQTITQDHLEREVVRLRAELGEVLQQDREAQEVWNTDQAVLNRLKGAHVQADEQWRLAEQERMRAWNQVNTSILGLQQLQMNLTKAHEEQTFCQAELLKLSAAMNPFVEEAKKLEERRDQLGWEVEAASDAVDQAEENLEYTNYWVRAFGPKGLKNYILDSKLQEMTDAANYWVRLLTGGTFWIRFETQKKGRSTKKLSNEMNIRVFRYNPDGRISERNYKSWSGGEKKRVSLAIDFGLSRLVSRRAKKRYDLLILDELFKHVDSAGGEAIAEMLEELKKEKSSLFVIEHDGDFQSRFENRVIVRRQGARSTIVELTNDVSGKGQAASRGEAKPKRKAIRRRVSG